MLSNAAHPVVNVRNSTEIHFASGWADLDGRIGRMTGQTVSKTAGTLDVALNLRSLGIDADGSLFLTGSRHEDEIWWEFDQPLSVTLDDFSWTRRIDGRLVAHATHISGLANPTCGGLPCPYSIQLDEDSSTSYVRIHGTTTPFFEWSKVAEVGFEMFSGEHRPALESLAIVRPGGLCARSEDRRYSGRVSLEDAAPASGMLVRLSSDEPEILRNRVVRVPAGARSTTFDAVVPGGYEGTTTFTAAAGGILARDTLTVGASKGCVVAELGFDLDDVEAEFGCRGCAENLQLSAGQGALVSVFDETFVRDPEGYWLELDKYIGADVDNTHISDMGDLVGMLAQAEDVAYYLSGASLDDEVVLVPGFSPTGFGRRSIAVGSMVSEATESLPGYFAAGTPVKLDIGLQDAVFDGISSGGIAFGHSGKPGEETSFILTEDTVSWLPAYGGRATLVAVNAVGDLTGTVYVNGYEVAYLIPAGSQEPLFIWGNDLPRTRAMGIDESGVVVVNRVGEQGTPDGVVLFSEQSGPVPLEAVLGQLGQFASVTEVTHVNGASDLAVRGTIDGKFATFGLRRVSPEGSQ